MKRIILLGLGVFILMAGYSQNPARWIKGSVTPETPTFALGLDSILEGRMLAQFKKDWQISNLQNGSGQSDQEILADSSNLVITRALIRDDSGDFKQSLVLMKGGLDTASFKMNPEGYLQLSSKNLIIAHQWLNRGYIESYMGLLYFEALQSRVRVANLQMDEDAFHKRMVVKIRKDGIQEVFVRASQLTENINTPSAVADLSSNLAELWKRDDVEQYLNNFKTQMGYLDVVSIKEGDSYVKKVSILGVKGLIYQTDFPAKDDASNRLNKQEFISLMGYINQQLPK